MKSYKNIPSLDLNNFTTNDKSKKLNFVKELGAAYEEVGFLSLKNYGLNNTIETELYKEVQKFFTLPAEIKSKYEKPELNGQRGFVSFGKEKAKGHTKSDLKEFWHFGQQLEKNDPLMKEYEPNVICTELPRFNKLGREVFKTLEETGISILRAIGTIFEST